jgi:hypothetical protein
MTAAEIIGIPDINEEEITVPEWSGAKFLVRALTGQQRAEVMQAAMRPNGAGLDVAKMWAALIIAGLHDPETRKPVFEKAHRDALMQKSGAALERIADVVTRLSGMSQGAVTDAMGNLSAGSEASTLQ